MIHPALTTSTRALDFHVPGAPAPQGSKRQVNGHFIEANKRTRPWRALVRDAAEEAKEAQNVITFTGPVGAYLTFFKARPKAHYYTGKNAEVLREDAPFYVTTKPDVDKLTRAIFDALTDAQVFRDDSQVAELHVRHLFADRDNQHFASGGVSVTVVPIQ